MIDVITSIWAKPCSSEFEQGSVGSSYNHHHSARLQLNQSLPRFCLQLQLNRDTFKVGDNSLLSYSGLRGVTVYVSRQPTPFTALPCSRLFRRWYFFTPLQKEYDRLNESIYPYFNSMGNVSLSFSVKCKIQ